MCLRQSGDRARETVMPRLHQRNNKLRATSCADEQLVAGNKQHVARNKLLDARNMLLVARQHN